MENDCAVLEGLTGTRERQARIATRIAEASRVPVSSLGIERFDDAQQIGLRIHARYSRAELLAVGHLLFIAKVGLGKTRLEDHATAPRKPCGNRLQLIHNLGMHFIPLDAAGWGKPTRNAP